MTTAKLLLSLLFIGFSIWINAQCVNNNTFLMDATPPASPGISSMTVNCMNGGQYVTVGVIAGNTYTFATCGNTAFDTELTVYNAAGGAFIAYNDDGCGVQSTITWVASFTGTVNVVLDNYPCLNSGLCTTLTITSTPPVQNGTGCNTNTTICTQGVAGPFGFSTPGPPVSTCLDFFGPNYAYIVLYITQSGPLQMLIDGNSATGYLDVAVFNVPPGVDPCIASLNTANQISCNYASSSSGCNQIGTAFPCPSSVPAPNVVAGQVLFIVVENWSGFSTNFTLDLANPPAAQTGPPSGAVNPAGPFCTSAAPVQLTAANAGGTWSGPGVSASGVFSPASVGPGSYIINYAIGSAPCQGTGSTTIVVTNTPTVNAVTNQVLCANTATTAINFTGSVVGATYNWTNSNTAIGLGASGTGNIPSFTATNATASPITATITVTPSVGGCTGTPITFTITVNPRPTVNAVANQTRCANTATTAINFSGSMGTATYNWTNSNTAIGLGASGTGNIPSFTATNSTSSPITSTITVTPTAGGCTGTPITFTITVNPTPTVTPVANQVLCATTATTAVNFSGPVAGTTYAWSNNNTAIGLGASGAGNIASFTATNATSSPITSTITVTPTANGCTGTPITFTITVNPRPTVNAVANQVLCANTATTAVNFSGSMGTATYNWTNSNTAIGLGASGSGNIPSFTATNATASPITSTITVTPTANGCTGTPITFTITVNPASNPSFTTTNFCQGAASPAATVTGLAGGTFSFNPVPGGGVTINPVTGSITGGVGGTTYTVQYTTSGACPQSSTQPVTVYALPNVVANDVSVCLGGTVAITATGAVSYTWNNGLGAGQTQNVSPIINTNYTVTGTDANGCVNTDIMTVTVVAGAPINAGPDVTICNGASTTLIASGGVSYTWLAPISAAGASQTVSPTTTTTYTVNGTAASGCTGTDQVTITVNPVPTVTAVADQVLCANTNTTAVNFTGAVVGTTYNWTNTNATIGLGAAGSGNIGAFSATNAGSTPQVATITVTPTASGCSGTPDVFTITVNPIPTVTAVADQVLCANTNTTAINFTGSVAGTTYNWTSTNSTIGLGASGSGNIGAFSAINAGSTPQVATITVTPTVNGCPGTPDVFTITVNPIPTVTPVADQVLCGNTNTTAINFTGAVAGATYNWVNTNATIGLGAAGSGNIGAFSAINAGSTPQVATITVTPTINGCAGTPDVFTITVNPIPTVTAVADQVLCANTSTTAINFTGSTVGATYNWTNTNTSIGLPAAGAGNIGSFTVTNAGATTQVSTITVTPTANGCSGTPDVFTITVNPIPTVTPVADQVLCASTNTTAINFTGAVAGATYNWVNTNATIGLGASGSGNIGAFSAVNAGSTPQVATVTVTPTANGCAGTPDVFTITVNPIPTVNTVANQVLCANSTTTAVNFSGSTAGATYNWVNTNATIGLGGSGSGNIGAFTGVNAGSTPQVGTITVTPTANGCAGLPTVFTITVNPMPTATISGTAVVCVGAAAQTITFTGANGVAPYTFSYNINGGATQTITSVGATATISVPSSTVGTFNYNLVSVQDASSTACSQAQVGTATITVNPNPTPVISGASQYCTGTFSTLSTTVPYSTYLWSTGASTPTVNVTIANNPITVTVTNAQGCSATSAVFTVVENSVITYSNTVEICQGATATIHGNVQSVAGLYSQTFMLPTGCDSISNITLVVHPLPIINAGVDQTVCAGTAVTLNAVGASTIVWNNGVTNGVPFTPAVGTVTYTATGTDGFGCVNTDAVDVTVNPIPSVNAIANQTLCAGANTTAVNFTGSVPATTYSWTNSNASIGLAASGTGNIGAFAATNAGSTPYVATIVVTPTANGCVGPTGQFTITVNPTPSVNPVANQTLCNTSSTTAVNFSSPVAGATYTWTNSNATIGLGASGSGNIGSFVATNAGSTAQVATITITPSANGCVGPTGQFTITVNPTPTVNPVANEILCAGANTTAVNFSSPVAGTTFAWSNNNASIGMGINGTGNIASFVAANAGSTPQVATITITPTANTCVGPTNSYTITVNPTPNVSPIANQTLCTGVNTTAVNFSGLVAGTTYNWTNSNASIGLAAAGSGNIGSFAVTNAGSTAQTATITVTPTANGCTGASQVFTITVNPTPTVNAVPNETLCNNSATTAVNFGSPVAGTTFAWTNNTPSIGLAGSGNGNIPSFNATNSTGSPVVGTITITPTANGCAGPTGQYTITVNPTPGVDAISNQTLCSGANTSAVNFTGSSAGITYNWTNTNTSIGLGAAGSGNIASFVAANAGATPQVASITVSPTQNGCIGASQIFTITVNPIPTVNPLVDETLCAGTNTTAINFSGSSATATYDWTNTNSGIGLAQSGTGNIPSFVATNATSGSISGTITVTPTENGCIGNPESAVITVNPLPTGTISGTAAVCIGAPSPSITLTGSNGVAPYTFTYNVNNTGNQTITSVGNSVTVSVPTVLAGVFNVNLVSVQDASVTGCVQTQAGVATITVNALPVVFAGNDFSICELDQAILTASGANTYAWDQGVVNGVAFTPASSGTYTVTGTDANGCVNTDDVTITIELAPVVSFFGDNLAGCSPLTVTFTNTTPGALTNCIWTLENGTTLNGCGTVTTTFNNPGTFDVTLTTTSATGCTASATYTDYIYVEADPIASFSPSASSVNNFEPEVTFDNTSSGAINYDWDFGDGSQINHDVSPTYAFPGMGPGTYEVELVAYSPLGCTDTAYATIEVTEDLLFYVPNTFTPDDDDYNPVFQPVFTSGYDPYDFTLLIYDRWGEIIFESHNAAIGWDGTYGGELSQDGTYTWKIEFKVTENDERKVEVGHVNLIR